MSNFIINKNYRPTLRNSIYTNNAYTTLNPVSKVIVGCYEMDSHLLIPKEKLQFYLDFFRMINGENSIEELSNKGFGRVKEVKKIVELLYEKGFLLDSINVNHFNEAEVMSTNLMTVKFLKQTPFLKQISNLFVRTFPKILIGLIILLMVLITCNYRVNILIGTVNYMLTTSSYIKVNLLVPFFFMLHEVAHRLYGIHYGLEYGELSVVLFLGIIPMVYVKQSNIYYLSRSEIINVVSAGVLMNIMVGVISLIIHITYGGNISLYVTLANFRIAFMNMIPLTLSDGYFLASLLIRKPNLRKKMYKVFANPKEITKCSKSETTILIIMIAAMVAAIGLELMWVLSFLDFGKRIILVSIALILYFLYLHKKSLKYI